MSTAAADSDAARADSASRPTSRYMELVEAFPLRPIRTDDQLAAATAVMRSLLGIELSVDEADYLDVLGDLIRAYEAEHHPMPQVTQGDILRALLEDRGVSQAELAAATGIADSNVSAMLANRRGISKANMIALGKFFGVEPGRFLV